MFSDTLVHTSEVAALSAGHSTKDFNATAYHPRTHAEMKRNIETILARKCSYVAGYQRY